MLRRSLLVLFCSLTCANASDSESVSTAQAADTEPETEWLVNDEATAKQLARELDRQVVAMVGADWCPPCAEIKRELVKDDAFREYLLTKFIFLEYDVDEPVGDAAFDRLGVGSLPTTFALNASLESTVMPQQPRNMEDFKSFIRALDAGMATAEGNLVDYVPDSLNVVSTWQPPFSGQALHLVAVTNRPSVAGKLFTTSCTYDDDATKDCDTFAFHMLTYHDYHRLVDQQYRKGWEKQIPTDWKLPPRVRDHLLIYDESGTLLDALRIPVGYEFGAGGQRTLRAYARGEATPFTQLKQVYQETKDPTLGVMLAEAWAERGQKEVGLDILLESIPKLSSEVARDLAQQRAAELHHEVRRKPRLKDLGSFEGLIDHLFE